VTALVAVVLVCVLADVPWLAGARPVRCLGLLLGHAGSLPRGSAVRPGCRTVVHHGAWRSDGRDPSETVVTDTLAARRWT
jgi:hypothetical protein